MFTKPLTSDAHETSCVSMARLNAKMNSIVDSFRLPTEKLMGHSSVPLVTWRDGCLCRYTRSRETDRTQFGRRTHSMVFCTPIQSTAYLGARHFFRRPYNASCGVLDDYEDRKRFEFRVLMEGTDKQRLNNGNSSYTVAFRYHGSPNYYISICFVVCENFTCSWSGIVTDCSIHHLTALEKDFALFDSIQVLHVVNYSNEDVRVWLESRLLWSALRRTVPDTGKFIDEDVNNDISEDYDDFLKVSTNGTYLRRYFNSWKERKNLFLYYFCFLGTWRGKCTFLKFSPRLCCILFLSFQKFNFYPRTMFNNQVVLQ